MTYIPSWVGCAGQRGVATLSCDDNRAVQIQWEATSCTTGYGVGVDQTGAKFALAFGMPETEALDLVTRELKSSGEKPELPSVYKPKEARKEEGFNLVALATG